VHVQDSRCEEDEPTLGTREVLDWCNGSGLGVGGSVAGAVLEGSAGCDPSYSLRLGTGA
jgi:hypothetical protein